MHITSQLHSWPLVYVNILGVKMHSSGQDCNLCKHLGKASLAQQGISTKKDTCIFFGRYCLKINVLSISSQWVSVLIYSTQSLTINKLLQQVWSTICLGITLWSNVNTNIQAWKCSKLPLFEDCLCPSMSTFKESSVLPYLCIQGKKWQFKENICT